MKKYFVILCLILGASMAVLSQTRNGGSLVRPAPTPSSLAIRLAKNAENLPKTKISREQRQEAYTKLLEGQRHFWIAGKVKPQFRKNRQQLAKNAFLKAIEINPRLAEIYTALADLELRSDGRNFEDILMFSNIATKLDRDNFGGHRYAAMVYSIKSNLTSPRPNLIAVGNAILSWKEVSRLDPRNAAAWAFLSALYKAKKQTDKRIDALRKWLSSIAPLDMDRRIYANIMRQDGDISNRAASVKLGEVLLEVGNGKEALEVLTRAVADYPRHRKAISLLTRALETADAKQLASPIEALRQAVFADPSNGALVGLLAQTIAKTGKIEEAVKVLKSAVSQSIGKNKFSASNLQAVVGDIYAGSDRVDNAISAYKQALDIRGISDNKRILDDNKDFAIRVIRKMTTILKKSNRSIEAEELIKKYKPLFGADDVQLGRLEIDFLIEIRKNKEALSKIKKARLRLPESIGLLRLEASVLTKLGRVDEGVALVNKLFKKKTMTSSAPLLFDGFSNYLFVSSLYTEARRKQEAMVAIKKALQIADNKEKKQIAKLKLAYTQQIFGNMASAERNLRDILKETPAFPIALNNLGYLLLEQNKNLDEAIKLIKHAINVEPNNSNYLDSLGWAYFKTGKLDQAEKYLKKAFRYNPSSAIILEHLGDVYKQKGRNNQAKETWQKALNFTSNNEISNRIRTKISLR